MAYEKGYTRNEEWKDLPDKTTPVEAPRLNNIETGIDMVDDRIVEISQTYESDAINMGRKEGSGKGYHSVTLGFDNIADFSFSMAFGIETQATEYAAIAEGMLSVASGYCSHAEGRASKAASYCSHAEGDNTKANGSRSHAEGQNTQANGTASHAEGIGNIANGDGSHAEGQNTQANSGGSHAEGISSVASGITSHAEGSNTQARGAQSHAEGLNTETADMSTGSHAEGIYTKAMNSGAHSEGIYTQANGQASHAEGFQTIATGSNQHVQGAFNIADADGQYAHIVGGGSGDSNRKNIHTLDWEGNAVFAGDVTNGNGISLDVLKAEIDALEGLSYEVVEVLPEEDIKTGVIYLVSTTSSENDNYDEFLYVDETWEKIGNTALDLSDYAKTEDIPTKVSDLTNDSDFITRSEVELLIYGVLEDAS